MTFKYRLGNLCAAPQAFRFPSLHPATPLSLTDYAETHHNRKRRRKCEIFRTADEAGAHAKRLAGEIIRAFVGGSGTGLQEGANYGAWNKPDRLHRRVQVVVVAPITGTGSAWWDSSPLPQERLLTH